MRCSVALNLGPLRRPIKQSFYKQIYFPSFSENVKENVKNEFLAKYTAMRIKGINFFKGQLNFQIEF